MEFKNLKISKDFNIYAFKQIGFILILTFLFFVLFLFRFGLVFASYLLWAFLVFGVFFIYLDLKFMFRTQNLENEIKDIKFIINNFRGDKK